jgi:undecaprenyl phosphate-alpha-L-ara4N flippase subunit ArnE
MKPLFWVLLVLSQLALVGGQIFLKHAMNATVGESVSRAKVVRSFATGIGLLTLWFFLWLALMPMADLSFLYPFEALSPLLLAFAASLILKEKMTVQLWVGMLLIVSGLLVVALSE